MRSQHSLGDYASFLEDAGWSTYEGAGLVWYKRNGFLQPACLPHSVPPVDESQVPEVVDRSGAWFARWDSGFLEVDSGPWWHVVRSGPYSMEQVSSNTRSKIRRGLKRLEIRRATVREIREQGLKVCEAAVRRYRHSVFMPDSESFVRRVEAAERHPRSCEFFGAFSDKKLVAFSENHLQGDAAFWESIWYDPAALGDYASYALIHVMLEDYLNERHLLYVTDGSRSLYHQTNVQDFLVHKFGFARENAHLSVVYSRRAKIALRLFTSFSGVIALAQEHMGSDIVNRMHGFVLQDRIARESSDLRAQLGSGRGSSRAR